VRATPLLARILGIGLTTAALTARAAPATVIDPWQAAASALECSLVSVVAEGLRPLQLQFRWSRDSATRLTVEAQFATSDIRDFNIDAPAVPAQRIEAKDAVGSIAGDGANRLLALVASDAPWSVTVGRAASPPLRFEIPAGGSVPVAMFEACVSANMHPRALTLEERSAIVSGPLEAPRFVSAASTPNGCRLAGTWLADRPIEFRFDATATGDVFRISYMPTFDTSKPRPRVLDLGSMGGPKASLNEDIQFDIPRDTVGALRADLLAGNPRSITITERKTTVAQLGFGVLVNEPAIRMFGACLTKRGI
jgi:hypothetical protein